MHSNCDEFSNFMMDIDEYQMNDMNHPSPSPLFDNNFNHPEPPSEIVAQQFTLTLMQNTKSEYRWLCRYFGTSSHIKEHLTYLSSQSQHIKQSSNHSMMQ
eukprot:1071033_1